MSQSQTAFANMIQSGDTKIDDDTITELFQMQQQGLFLYSYSSNTDDIEFQFATLCQELLHRPIMLIRVKRRVTYKQIINAFFKVSWDKFLNIISTLLRRKYQYTQIAPICVDALKYGINISSYFNLLEQQFDAFVRDLAGVVYMEQNKYLVNNKVHLAIVRGDHLKQKWFVDTIKLIKYNRLTVDAVISHICNDMRVRIIYDREQKLLRDLEIKFGSNLNLIKSNRKFIDSGLFQRQNLDDLLEIYLCNDLIICCKRNQDKLSVDVLLHLSLCSITNLQDKMFKIVSPQKNILLVAVDVMDKNKWFELINKQITEEIELREKWIKENEDMLRGYDKYDKVNIGISKYLSRVICYKMHELERINNGNMMHLHNAKLQSEDVKREIDIFENRKRECKLCQKRFKLFVKKMKCGCCQDIVCKQCFIKKSQMLYDKRTKKYKRLRICYACFGSLTVNV
eukprot:131576_1